MSKIMVQRDRVKKQQQFTSMLATEHLKKLSVYWTKQSTRQGWAKRNSLIQKLSVIKLEFVIPNYPPLICWKDYRIKNLSMSI